jgi:hypothetical protein
MCCYQCRRRRLSCRCSPPLAWRMCLLKIVFEFPPSLILSFLPPHPHQVPFPLVHHHLSLVPRTAAMRWCRTPPLLLSAVVRSCERTLASFHHHRTPLPSEGRPLPPPSTGVNSSAKETATSSSSAQDILASPVDCKL